MTKTQLALYLGKLPVHANGEGGKARLYLNCMCQKRGVDPNFEYPVQGDSWEEKFKFMTKHILAEKTIICYCHWGSYS